MLLDAVTVKAILLILKVSFKFIKSNQILNKADEEESYKNDSSSDEDSSDSSSDDSSDEGMFEKDKII
jgi:hypothetical protein